MSIFITCFSFELLSNRLFKNLPESFFIAQSQKSYGVRKSFHAVSNPCRRLLLFYHPPPPPHLPTYAHTILLVEKLSGGGVKIIRQHKFMRRQNSYPGRARLDRKFEKKSHSDEDNPFHILIHRGTIPNPYTVPKTLSQYIAVLS